MVFGMLGRRQVTPGWEGYPVRLQDGRQWLGRRGRSGMPPRIDIRQGGLGSISKLCNNKRRSLGPEWSMSEVGTSPSHNMDKTHRLVFSNTYTQTHVGNYSIICGTYKHLYLHNMGCIT